MYKNEIPSGKPVNHHISQAYPRKYLELASTSWEDNQFGLVCFQPLNVSLESLQGVILATVINCNSYCRSKFLWNTSSLEKEKKMGYSSHKTK
jgi:hypothetical protein